jgi:hypothetical protein
MIAPDQVRLGYTHSRAADTTDNSPHSRERWKQYRVEEKYRNIIKRRENALSTPYFML